MSGGVLVASLGITAAILLFLFLKLGEEQETRSGWTRYPLQILVLGFLLGTLVLLGKTAYDYKDNCAWLVSNSTVSGGFTSYGYGYNCSENTQNTASTYYQITVWVMRLVIAYLVLVFVFEFILYLGWWKRGGKQP